MRKIVIIYCYISVCVTGLCINWSSHICCSKYIYSFCFLSKKKISSSSELLSKVSCKEDQKLSLGAEMGYYLEFITCDPSTCIMEHPIFIESISTKRVTVNSLEF